MEQSRAPRPGDGDAPGGRRRWRSAQLGAVAVVAALLAALFTLGAATAPVAGARGTSAQLLLAVALVLLVANWIGQWNPRAPEWSAKNRWLRLSGALLWLGVSVFPLVVFADGAQLPAGYPSIVGFELVGEAERAKDLAGEAYAATGQVMRDALAADYWFIVSYVGVLAGLVLWFGHYYRVERFRDQRIGVAGAAVAAGLLDVIENRSLAEASQHLAPGDAAWAWAWPVAASMAWPKFVILVAVAAYLLGALVSLAWSGPWLSLRRLAPWGKRRPGPHGASAFWALLPNPPDPGPGAVEDELSGSADRGLDDKQSFGSERKLGIALSGGGIRASSISLGALQMLESDVAGVQGPKMGWREAHEITAISGGSNMAAGWSISRSRRVHSRTDPQGRPGNTFELGEPLQVTGTPDAWRMGRGVGHDNSPEEDHLFDNLGYLVAPVPRGDDVAAVEYAGPRAELPVDKPPAYEPSAYATVLAGFLVNVSVFLLILWFSVRPLGWLYRGLASLHGCAQSEATERAVCLAGRGSMVLPGLAAVLLGLAVLMIWVLLARMWTRSRVPGSGREPILAALKAVCSGALTIGGFLLVLLLFFPLLMALAGQVPKLFDGGASVLSLLGAIGTVLPVIRLLRKPTARFAPALGGVVFVLLISFLSAYWAFQAFATAPLLLSPRTEPPWIASWEFLGVGNSVTWWLIAGLVLLGLYQFGRPGAWSLAPFYRGKLRIAYATRRKNGRVASYGNDDNGAPDREKEPSLHTYLTRASSGAEGTPLTICTTSTVSSRGVRTHYGIPALSVTFDPDRVRMFIPQDLKGHWAEYSCPTWAMDSISRRFGQGRLTTMLAVAISSAAVSPAMGRYRIGPTSMLLTFANVRLGVWMPNPRYVGEMAKDAEERAKREVTHAAEDPRERREARRRAKSVEVFEDFAYPRVRFGYLFKEFLGIHDMTDPYVYLTDGGHWENTGLVELLRRGNYREIVCVDADPGPGDAVRSLSQAIDLAALECDAVVNVNLDPLRATVKGTGEPDYATRSVTVGFFELHQAGVGTGNLRPDLIGVLWYGKPALTSEMPAPLLAHRETHPSYPRISTFDQFFDASTFIAYRDLGRYNAQAIRRARAELLDAMEYAAQRVETVGPLLRELRDINPIRVNQIDDFYARQDAATTRLLKEVSNDPDPAAGLTEFDVFSAHADKHWACEEIVSLVSRRVVDRTERENLYKAIQAALAYAPATSS